MCYRGYGPQISAALGRHHNIDYVTLICSTNTGKKLLSYSGESNMKQVWLECGDKNPNIIFADTLDPSSTGGALISVDHLYKVQGYITQARQEGHIVFSGNRIRQYSQSRHTLWKI